jgi:hypothetical protein
MELTPLERVAMQAETIAGQLPAGQRTPNIHEAGASPGLSVEEGRELAVSMQDVGWAVLNFANNSMRLTEAGGPSAACAGRACSGGPTTTRPAPRRR